MAREVRQAGGNACGVAGSPTVVGLPPPPPLAWTTNWETAGPIQGFDGAQEATGIVEWSTASNDNKRVNGTDAIKLLGGNLSAAHIFTSTTPTDFVLQSGHGLANGLFTICDTATAVIGNGNASPSGFVGVQMAANTAQFSSGGFASSYSAGFWYVGNNTRGGRSLYRTGIGTGGSGIQEIAEGVVDMQIDYLLRLKPISTDTPPGPPDEAWLGAYLLTWSNGAGGPATPWIDGKPDISAPTIPTKEVVAARLTLTLETLDSVGTNARPITRQLIHVVNLRNKGMR